MAPRTRRWSRSAGARKARMATTKRPGLRTVAPTSSTPRTDAPRPGAARRAGRVCALGLSEWNVRASLVRVEPTDQQAQIGAQAFQDLRVQTRRGSRQEQDAHKRARRAAGGGQVLTAYPHAVTWMAQGMAGFLA